MHQRDRQFQLKRLDSACGNLTHVEAIGLSKDLEYQAVNSESATQRRTERSITVLQTIETLSTSVHVVQHRCQRAA